MRILRNPLARFAVLATCGVVVRLILTYLLQIDRRMQHLTAIWMGLAVWLAGIRTGGGALLAILLAAALFMALAILPFFLLIGGTFNMIANRQLAQLALTMAALSALPVAVGWTLTRYRPFRGDRA